MHKTELFSPILIKPLLSWILKEYDTNKSIFGIPDALFFTPSSNDKFKMTKFGTTIETPLGVAAGPHTQMAQNIISAWLCGARFIELKTVQTLDELDVSKPCIDGFDEGYNCEWSQELKLDQSFKEYLMAWIIIHILRHKFNWKGELGTLFNMSVGYNMEGILKDNVQQFLKKMVNASVEKAQMIAELKAMYPQITDITIPDRLANNMTLSTMHGCPPSEIEKIARYFMENGWNTFVKFNPTLLGPELLRGILNKELGFPIDVPDTAFEHDPKFEAATTIVKNLTAFAKEKGVSLGVKTTNTLESMNLRKVLPEKEKQNYMSGRALHPLSINVAKKLNDYFKGELNISLAGGATAFNFADVISCNIRPVTVCTDILKPGGYSLLKQYLEQLSQAMLKYDAMDIDDYICKVALTKVDNITEILPTNIDASKFPNTLKGKTTKDALKLALNTQDHNELNESYQAFVKKCGLYNLIKYADHVRRDHLYHKDNFEGVGLKVDRELPMFDCIAAPCTSTCPTNQDIPGYLYWVAKGDYKRAMYVILKDNPLPNTLGNVCDHLCQARCVRTHYDQPLAIREIKRFVSQTNQRIALKNLPSNGIRVAIIGAGPAGLSAAYFLALAGYGVTIYEEKDRAGGQSRNTIPAFRLSQDVNQKDVDHIKALGVDIQFNQSVSIKNLEKQGFQHIFIAVGAKHNKKLAIPGENAEGVFDSLKFLNGVKTGTIKSIGKRVAIVGGGNSAIDAARTAWRLNKDAQVKVLYRRTKSEMPAGQEEIDALIGEGIEVVELVNPKRIITADSHISGIECTRNALGEPDSSGRPRPVPIANSEFVTDIDTLIVAIGQETDLTLLDGTDIKITKQSTIEIDPITRRTSKAHIYAGGDVVRGPASVVKAVGDGKAVAFSIIWEDTKGAKERKIASHEITANRVEMLTRKSRKLIRDPHFTPDYSTACRDFSDEHVAITEDIAKAEASRCLICSEMCSICETVCPNRANITYQITPFECEMKSLKIQGTTLVQMPTTPYRVQQRFQVLNIQDFCNECGNCATFCPTKGAPYKNKPKLFLKETEFNDFTINYSTKCYFFTSTATEFILKMKMNQEKHELRVNKQSNELRYTNSALKVTLNGNNFNIKKIELLVKAKEGTDYSLLSCAEMYTLIKGISESLPFLIQ